MEIKAEATAVLTLAVDKKPINIDILFGNGETYLTLKTLTFLLNQFLDQKDMIKNYIFIIEYFKRRCELEIVTLNDEIFECITIASFVKFLLNRYSSNNYLTHGLVKELVTIGLLDRVQKDPSHLAYQFCRIAYWLQQDNKLTKENYDNTLYSLKKAMGVGAERRLNEDLTPLETNTLYMMQAQYNAMRRAGVSHEKAIAFFGQ